jgi:hypothetical protein
VAGHRVLAIGAVLSLVGATAAAGSTAKVLFNGNGTYRVGKDIRPGTYRSLGGDGCYWARLKSFSGSLGSILANENASGPTLVTILGSDRGFETENCASWTARLVRITKSPTRFGEGTYVVRLDIAPGTYRSRGGDGCYWERMSSFTGGLGSIIANDNPRGPTIVTIRPTDKGFKSERCATWSRI